MPNHTHQNATWQERRIAADLLRDLRKTLCVKGVLDLLDWPMAYRTYVSLIQHNSASSPGWAVLEIIKKLKK